MKKLATLSVLICLITISAFAQNPKKYVLLEHFTNTNCSVCASRNPAFFNTIANYDDIVHHISIHPPVPYVNCRFYQDNKPDNDARKNFYSVFSSPQVFMNGVKTPGSNPLITAAALEAEKGKTSPIEIKVSEAHGFDKTDVTVQIKAYDTAPIGETKLFVAVLEKEIDYSSPNGEKLHHNVLRKFLTSNLGEQVTLPAPGQSTYHTFQYSLIGTNWKADEVYVLAWVQNTSTKEVLNSGTKFDITAGARNTLPESAWSVFPNPFSKNLNFEFGAGLNLEKMILRNLQQQILQSWENPSAQAANFNWETLPKGIYFLELQTAQGSGVRKIVKN